MFSCSWVNIFTKRFPFFPLIMIYSEKKEPYNSKMKKMLDNGRRTWKCNMKENKLKCTELLGKRRKVDTGSKLPLLTKSEFDLALKALENY